MTTQPSALIELTQGNINNAHFYLRSCLWMFEPEVIGASDQGQGLGRTVTVHYRGLAEPCETDIAPPNKLFFRRRGPVRAFFAHHRMRAGDRIRITRTDCSTYIVSPERS